MNDYEVSIFHPHRIGEDGDPLREVVKKGLSLDDAVAWARERVEAKPRAMYDLCITQPQLGGGFKIIKTVYRFDR